MRKPECGNDPTEASVNPENLATIIWKRVYIPEYVDIMLPHSAGP